MEGPPVVGERWCLGLGSDDHGSVEEEDQRAGLFAVSDRCRDQSGIDPYPLVVVRHPAKGCSMKLMSPRDAYIYYFKYYLKISSELRNMVLGLWVGDPLDIVQVVYRIEESNLLRGRARYEPVEDWGDKIPNPPKLETMDPDSIVRVLDHIDPANNAIHHMAMMLAIDIREPSEIQVINNGIGWIGEPTDILPDRYKVPLG